MNEYFKQIFEAWGDRVKTPFIGSILISFIAINWKVIFYLLFADKPVRARLLYFEANTTEISLYVLPLVVGLLAAILLPWASVIGAFLGRYPKARLHGIQHS